MNRSRLHSIVFFVDNIEQAAADHATLFGAVLVKQGSFISMRIGELMIGFHPADERSQAGSAVPYFATTDLDQAIEAAGQAGYAVYRGPITVAGEVVVQLRNKSDMKIGYVQKL